MCGPEPKIKFKIDDLFEQGSFFRLLLDLSDRSIISNRTVVEQVIRYKYLPELEKLDYWSRLHGYNGKWAAFKKF